MKILVSQIGAREHYAVARALHRRGMLAALVTDWYAFGRQNAEILKTEILKSESALQNFYQRFSVSAFQRLGMASAKAARCDAIPDALVRAFPLRSLLWKWQLRRRTAQEGNHAAYTQTDAAFASAAARLQLPAHEVFFGYSYASLEMLAAEIERGVLTVLDQIDPGAVEFRLVAEEMARHPELAGPPPPFPTAYFQRNRREWDLADIIVVNSAWTREAIIAEGADPDKIEILPLAFEAEGCERSDQLSVISDQAKAGEISPTTQDGGLGTGDTNQFQLSAFQVSALPPLRVLWLGQVNVRKGIHYLIEAARLLERENIQFDIVGPVGILPGVVAAAPRNMTFHGAVSRNRAAEWYRQSDVFVLPTLSDGFALTQLEALAHGLPVIATPNCGLVVEDGKTGFIVPARDGQALAEAVLRFARAPGLAAEMEPRCREAVKAYSVDAYGRRLVEIIEKHQVKRL